MAPTFTLAQQLVLTFLILGTSTPKAEVSRSQCEQCLVTTRHGNKVTKTLVYHSHYNCKEQTTSCVHNTTTYEICPNNESPIASTPKGHSSSWTLRSLDIKALRNLVSIWEGTIVLPNPQKPKFISILVMLSHRDKEGEGSYVVLYIGNNLILPWKSTYIMLV